MNEGVDAHPVRDNGKPIGEEKFASPRWDLSQERAFLENLLGQRTNFLLIFFGITLAGGVNARELPEIQNTIFALGALISFLLTLAVGRAQKKLDIIIGLLKKDPLHPIAVVDGIAGPSGSKRRIIGYGIPWLCTVALATAVVLSMLGFVRSPQISEPPVGANATQAPCDCPSH